MSKVKTKYYGGKWIKSQYQVVGLNCHVTMWKKNILGNGYTKFDDFVISPSKPSHQFKGELHPTVNTEYTLKANYQKGNVDCKGTVWYPSVDPTTTPPFTQKKTWNETVSSIYDVDEIVKHQIEKTENHDSLIADLGRVMEVISSEFVTELEELCAATEEGEITVAVTGILQGIIEQKDISLILRKAAEDIYPTFTLEFGGKGGVGATGGHGTAGYAVSILEPEQIRLISNLGLEVGLEVGASVIITCGLSMGKVKPSSTWTLNTTIQGTASFGYGVVASWGLPSGDLTGLNVVGGAGANVSIGVGVDWVNII